MFVYACLGQISVHQDPWGVQARRVSSVRPAVTKLQAPFNAWVVLRKCEAGNPRQIWFHGNEPNRRGSISSGQLDAAAAGGEMNGSVPGRLWTVDEDGQRWCMGECSWARPAEVMPCEDPQFDPRESLDCGCNMTSPCCHHTANFTMQFGPVCEGSWQHPKLEAPCARTAFLMSLVPCGCCSWCDRATLLPLAKARRNGRRRRWL